MSDFNSRKITVAEAIEALDAMDDFARMANVKASGPVRTLLDFILQHATYDDVNDDIGVQQTIKYLMTETTS